MRSSKMCGCNKKCAGCNKSTLSLANTNMMGDIGGVVATFAGSMAAEVLIYKRPFAVDTAISMGGPLGAAIGSAVGVALAVGVVLAGPGSDKAKYDEMILGMGIVIGGPILFVHFVGGRPWIESIVMCVSGSVAAMLYSQIDKRV